MKLADTQGKRPPGRPRQFESRQALEKALRLFWKRGYEGTSVADLTAAMGITAPSLYGAFGSKEGLYREALAQYVSIYGAYTVAALTEEKTAYDAIRRMLLDSARHFADPANPGGCMISTASLNCSPENRAASEAARSLRQATLDLLTRRIQTGIDAEELPSDADAAALARFFGAIVQGMSVQAVDGATEVELLRIAENALRSWPDVL